MKKVLYIGLDVHKETIVIATAAEGREEAREFKTIPSDYTRLLKVVRLLTPKGGSVMVCYEAGPTGYGLYRRLHEAGIDCRVVAPSLVPTKNGNRVKTDRRDAVRLAHYLRSGDLTDVYVPDEADEALRDLERARDAAKRAERTARHQLGKFLLRHDRRFSETKNWTVRHMNWVRRLKFEHAAQQRVLTDHLKTVEDAGERVEHLTDSIKELVESSALAPLIKALQAFRGIALVSATTIACEVGDLRRFPTAGHFMSYVGLVPSESSSGERRKQGSITRTGNGHLRRILVEAAWHYRRPPAMSKEIRRRNQPVADGVRRLAWKAQKRLHKRMYHLTLKGKNNKTAVIAVARELAGFIWAVAQEPELLAT
jgi:transposase